MRSMSSRLRLEATFLISWKYSTANLQVNSVELIHISIFQYVTMTGGLKGLKGGMEHKDAKSRPVAVTERMLNYDSCCNGRSIILLKAFKLSFWQTHEKSLRHTHQTLCGWGGDTPSQTLAYRHLWCLNCHPLAVWCTTMLACQQYLSLIHIWRCRRRG